MADSVTSIYSYAFYGCTALESITISDSLTTVNQYAFYGCTALTKIELPDSVTTINQYAFYGCTALADIEMSYSVATIGTYAFYGCTALESVVLPSTVTTMNSSAFRNCSSLETAVILSSSVDINLRTFYGDDSLTALISVSEGTVYDSEYTISSEDVVIYGISGSDLNTYATNYSKTFVAIDYTTTEADCGNDGVMTITVSEEADEDVLETLSLSVGDVVWEGTYTPATGEHTAGDEGVVTEATCTVDGYTTYTCSVCGTTYEDDVVEATGHTWNDGTVTEEATCTTSGTILYTCTACGETYTEATEATGHVYEAVVTDPTCTDEGYTTYTCTVCGDSYTSDYVDALGHSYVVTETVDATCEADGYMVYTCENDESHTYTEIISATGHTEGEAVVENNVDPTCTETGSYDTVVYCTVCGAELSRVTTTVEALGHSYESVVTDPTCVDEGYTTYICSTCGDTYISDYVDALGHSYEAVETVDSTCTEDGYATYTCSVCGDTYTEILTAGHSYVSTTINATCTSVGYVVYICTVCEESYTEVIEATGHSYEVTSEEVVDDVTIITYTCSVCGDAYEAEASDTVTVSGQFYNAIDPSDLTVRGSYLAVSLSIDIIDSSGTTTGRVTSDEEGNFELELAANSVYSIYIYSSYGVARTATINTGTTDIDAGYITYILCDYAQDGSASVADASAMSGYIETMNTDFGDLNGDGAVNVSDQAIVSDFVSVGFDAILDEYNSLVIE